jgi:hypothetical protein
MERVKWSDWKQRFFACGELFGVISKEEEERERRLCSTLSRLPFYIFYLLVPRLNFGSDHRRIIRKSPALDSISLSSEIRQRERSQRKEFDHPLSADDLKSVERKSSVSKNVSTSERGRIALADASIVEILTQC